MIIINGEIWLRTDEALDFSKWKSRSTLYKFKHKIRNRRVHGYRDTFWNRADMLLLLTESVEEEARNVK